MLTVDQSFPKKALIGMGTFYHQWKYFTPRKDAEKSESSGCRPLIILTSWKICPYGALIGQGV